MNLKMHGDIDNMLLFIFMCLIGFAVGIIRNYANGSIAYNQAYCIEKAKQRVQNEAKTWDELWKESGLTDADLPELLEALQQLQKEKG